MKRRRLGLTVVAMLGLGLGLAGCPEPTKKKPVQPDSSAGGDGGTGGGFGGSGGGSGGSGGGSGGSGGGSGGSGGGSGGSGGSGGRDAGSGGSGGSGGRDGGTAGTGGRDGGGTTADSGARDGGGGATGTVSFRTNVAPILMKCVGCHPPATAAMGYMWFQQNAATGRACAGRKRLDVVVSKLDPAATAACGGKMPPAAAPMKPTAAEIETVKTWVMEGGMNN